MAQELAVIERQLFAMRPMFEQLVKPTGADAERIIRTVVISCDRTPKLLECTPQSVLQAATTGAVLGLEADGVTGQGYLVPFRDKRRGLIAQWLTGYKGYSSLAARVGLTINGGVVRDGDEFDFEEGSAGFVRHKKLLGVPDRRLIAAWATASALNRPPIVSVIDIDDIMAIKARSKAAGSGDGFSPWDDPKVGFPAMAEKTSKRRLSRSLPLSAYIVAARIDEAHEEQGKHAYLHPEHGIVIDADDSVPVRDTAGPSLTALQHRMFLVETGRGRQVEIGSIGEWKARMIDRAQNLTEEQAARFAEMNAERLTEYRADFREEVEAVEEAFGRRRASTRIPERATAVDPEPKPVDAPAATQADAMTTAGSSSEAAPAARRGESPEFGHHSEEAGGSPANPLSGTAPAEPAEKGAAAISTEGYPGPSDTGSAENATPAASADQPGGQSEFALTSEPQTIPRTPAPPQRPQRSDWYSKESLRLEPTRHAGRANWASWYAAMFLPRLKGAQNTGDLAHLLGDNADLIDLYRRETAPNEITLLNAAIERQWQHVAAWEA